MESNSLGADLLRFNETQKYLIFDTESCGLNLMDTNNVPWEYAWFLCTRKEILKRGEYMVKWPKIDISRQAALITNYYAKQPLQFGADPKKVLAEFEEILYDPSIKVIAHNALGFDVYLHRIHRLRMGKKSDWSYLPRVLDTNVLARANKLGIQVDRTDLLAFQYKMMSHHPKGCKTNLGQLCADYNIPYDKGQAHAALYDIEKTYEVFKRLVFEVEI